ncbi:MAG: cytochrome c biogenesis protein CcsA [Planctomycetota bacterium]
MSLPWIWGPLHLILLALSFRGALRRLMGESSPSTLVTTLMATLVLAGGIGLQCANGISVIGSMANTLLPLCLLLLTSSMLMEVSLRTPWVPLLTHPVSFVLALTALRFMKPVLIAENPSTILRWHILSSVLGYVLLLLASLAAILLWIQDRRLKRHVRIPGRFPSLELLEGLTFRFLLVSALSLTVSIGLGAGLGRELFGRGFSGRFEWIFVFTLATWTLQGTTLLLAWRRILTAVPLAMATLTITGVALLGFFGGGH